ncbi:MAG: hypothetical protein H8E12_12845 [Rhodobacteraceae bacterium]|nr:hypothetical protein [Paracoccaceae bacterium]
MSVNTHMDEGNKQNWVIIVYNDGEKVDSRLFCNMSEGGANKMACEWANKTHEGNSDWSLHHVVSSS